MLSRGEFPDETGLDIIDQQEFKATIQTYVDDLTTAIQSLNFSRVASLREHRYLNTIFFTLIRLTSLDKLQERVDQFINTFLVDLRFPQKGNVSIPFFILEKLNINIDSDLPIHYEDLATDPQVLPKRGEDGKLNPFGQLTKPKY